MKSSIISSVHKILGLFLIIVLGSLNLGSGQAAAESARITGSVVNVRSGPGESYDIVGMLARDTSINVVERSNGWCRMQAGNVSGWVEESLVGSVPEAATLRVTAAAANLRAGAGTSFAKLGEAKKGDSLKLLGVHGDWYQIQTVSGLYGFINSSLVEKQSGTAVSSDAGSRASTAANAGTSQNSTAVSEDIPVYVNGTRVNFDVKPVIENGRTLVPMRAIFEAMGAGIEWDGDSQTVRAQKGETRVVLTIGSLSPTVDGKAVQLDVPAKIVGNRTLAPLRFVGEALGGRVAWDPSAREVRIYSPDSPGDKLAALIIDRDEVNLRSLPSTSGSVMGAAARGQQYGIMSESDGWYKVNYLGKDAWVAGWLVKLVWSSGSSTYSSDSSNSSRGSNAPAGAGPLLNIQFAKDADGFRLTMEGTEKLKADISEGSGSIDYIFTGCQLSQDVYFNEQVGGGSITISGSNTNGNVKVHAALPGSLKYKTSIENNGKRQVLFIPNCIVSLERQTFNGSGERIIINTALPCAYTEQQSGKTMTITLSGTGRGLAQESYTFDSQTMKSLTVNESGSSAIVKITTKEEAKFALGSSDSEKSIHILFINKSDIPARNSLVVLDPGHGGRDIGASGETLSENTVNLDLALKTGALLTRKGIKVQYTRTDDTYVSLADRAATANLLNAALFVSIHNNAHSDSSKMGTETYYYAPMSNPEQYLQKDERENLATQIQTRLVANLGRTDRGVKTANFQVLRDTEMPSALAECVFISNPEEENLLKQEKYKNLIAQAIADGIAACMKGITAVNPKL